MKDMELKQYINTDDAIFHYTKLSVAVENILSTKKLKLSLFKDTNDPKEYEFRLLSATNVTSPEKSLELINKATQIINRKIRSKCKLLCFCSNKKPFLIVDKDIVEDEYAYSEGCKKSRMWSQYSENHEGVCLVFSKKDVEDELKKQLLPKGAYYKFDYVQYSQKQGFDRRENMIDCDSLIRQGAENYSTEYIKKNIREIFFRKHIDYRDEAEYRMVVFDAMKHLGISSSIKGVIAGNRTPEVYFSLIKQLCEKLKIGFLKVSWGRSGEGLYFQSL